MNRTLKDIVPESVLGINGTIINRQSYERQEQYIKYNSSWLNLFDTVIFAYNGEKKWIDFFIESVQLHTPNIKIILEYSDNNLGHTFGTMDNDNRIFKCANLLDKKYLWKFSIDVIADNILMDVYVDTDYDFFYINNIGYAALHDSTKQELFEDIKSQKYFYPQTNYYIIKNHINFYPDINTILSLKKEYEEIKKDHPEYNPWDAIQGCDCEHMLAKTIRDNNLKAKHLLNDEDTHKILNLIEEYQWHDGSHKNIQYTNVGNLCHYHIIGAPVAPI